MSIAGRNYSGLDGKALDVVAWDARVLSANGWLWLAECGPVRPANPERDQRFIDTTLQKMIIWDGGAWRDPGTGDRV